MREFVGSLRDAKQVNSQQQSAHSYAVTFISISAAVCLVVSSFSTSTLSPRKLLSAADSLVSSSSSRSFSSILNMFCCLVSSLCREVTYTKTKCSSAPLDLIEQYKNKQTQVVKAIKLCHQKIPTALLLIGQCVVIKIVKNGKRNMSQR